MKKPFLYFFLITLISACTVVEREQIKEIPRPTATVIQTADISVCASGCDYALIQDAIDADKTVFGGK